MSKFSEIYYFHDAGDNSYCVMGILKNTSIRVLLKVFTSENEAQEYIEGGIL